MHTPSAADSLPVSSALLDLERGASLREFNTFGLPAAAQYQRAVYVATVSCDDFLKALFADLLKQAGVETVVLPHDVRLARRGGLTFLFNYSAKPSKVAAPANAQWLLGSATLDGYGVAIYR